MAWPTLNYRPDYGSSKSAKFNLDTMEFGDGYDQDSYNGAGPVRETLTLKFSLPVAQAEALYQQLVAWRGVQRFKFRMRPTDPLRGYKTQGDPSKTEDNWGRATVTATFVSVVEKET